MLYFCIIETFNNTRVRVWYMSIFVGIDITDINVIESIHTVQSSIVQSSIHIKPTNLTKIHLTLHFLGNINKVSIQKAINTLAELEFSRFDMRLIGLDVFSRNRPSVIWIGLDRKGHELLVDLANNIHRCLDRVGLISKKFMPEKFTPHITVFRTKNKISDLEKILRPYKTKDFGVQHVNSIKLKESQAPNTLGYLDLQEVVAI